jgi:putative multicomponent Na+:H+ antiporter subunit B
MDDYVYIITALLPLAAMMVVFQTNPYHALVIRGILGAIAALVYTVLGAADVALTEALVGTLLAITLYAVAVRSSLVLRLGVLKDEIEAARQPNANSTSPFKQLMDELRAVFRKRYMRVELVPYLYAEDLRQALIEKAVHATCLRSPSAAHQPSAVDNPTVDNLTYITTTRLPRIHDILKTELSSPLTRPIYASPADLQETHS